MIRSDAEYREAKKQIEENGLLAQEQRRALAERNLTEDQVDRAMQPMLSFHAQIIEELEWYERVKRREFVPLDNLTHIGRLLIGLRIANGMSQKELAERLGISEAQVSRDERNEYHNITVERIQKVIEALNERVRLVVTDEPFESTRRSGTSSSAQREPVMASGL